MCILQIALKEKEQVSWEKLKKAIYLHQLKTNALRLFTKVIYMIIY